MTWSAVIAGDCLDTLRGLPSESVDAVVTDPPYGLSKAPDMAEVLRHWLDGDDYKHKGGGFMGNTWDSFVPGPAVWRECLRVLKPGGHLLAFFGSRTYDLGTTALRLAGFEIRDQIMWVYGTGFPKSLDVAKAIDRARIEERAASERAAPWKGWGTGLKPAHEPIVVARKPLAGSVASNVLAHSTGALNIDGCRVEMSAKDADYISDRIGGFNRTQSIGGKGKYSGGQTMDRAEAYDPGKGRWPTNLIHDGSDEVTELFGKAARFFYCAKASKADRGEGNTHPTVKPTDLMARLCRLVTPPGGTVLDPFTGSGSTGKAATREGFSFIGCELSADFAALARRRIAEEADR